MERGKRIPLHNHDGPNSGGLVVASTIVTAMSSGGSTATVPAAAAIPIADLGALYVATNVEAALAEVAATSRSWDEFALTADTNDFALGTPFYMIGLQATVPLNLTGLAAETQGAAHIILNQGGYPITLIHDSTSSAVGNRFYHQDRLDLVLEPFGSVLISYSTRHSHWLVVDPAVASLDAIPGVNAPAPDDGYVLTWDSTPGEWVAAAAPGAGGGDTSGQFVAIFDGGGAAITAGAAVDVIAPYTGSITGWTMLADQSGSAVVDVLTDTYAGFPTFTSITASAKPTISTAIKATSSTLTGWTTAVTAGDILRFNLDSSSTLTRLLLVLRYSRP